MLEREQCIEVSRHNSGERHIVRCGQIIEILAEMGKDLRRHSSSDGKQTGCFNCSLSDPVSSVDGNRGSSAEARTMVGHTSVGGGAAVALLILIMASQPVAYISPPLDFGPRW